MNRKLKISFILIAIAILSYFMYEMYPFAKGVQNDAVKQKEFMKNIENQKKEIKK